MFQSTQPQNPTRCTLKEALLGPLPDPHHLWTPSTLPPLDTLDPQSSLQKLLSKILLSFGFPEKLCQDPLGFDPVRLVGDQFQLWHGPTESFKDLGCDACIRLYRQWFPEKTVVVATSGDTGGGGGRLRAPRLPWHRAVPPRSRLLLPSRPNGRSQVCGGRGGPGRL